jgi:hypothetical protein
MYYGKPSTRYFFTLVGTFNFHNWFQTGLTHELPCPSLLFTLEPNWSSHSTYYVERTEKSYDFLLCHATESLDRCSLKGILKILSASIGKKIDQIRASSHTFKLGLVSSSTIFNKA